MAMTPQKNKIKKDPFKFRKLISKSNTPNSISLKYF